MMASVWSRCWRRSAAPIRWLAANCVVRSAHGWLGLSGSRHRRTDSSAATDGWDDPGGRTHLHRGLSCVTARRQVPDSHVLSEAFRRLEDDFAARLAQDMLVAARHA